MPRLWKPVDNLRSRLRSSNLELSLGARWMIAQRNPTTRVLGIL